MSSFASALKAEIVRLAKKQAKQDVTPLRKIVTAQRSSIAALKREVVELKKAFAHAYRKARVPAFTAEEPGRFIVKGMATHRKRIGLSADEYGKLVGASDQTIYNWEQKKRSRDLRNSRLLPPYASSASTRHVNASGNSLALSRGVRGVHSGWARVGACLPYPVESR